MSAGPWVVIDEDGLVSVVLAHDMVKLQVLTVSESEDWKWAHRIAERLNATEGDQR